MVDAEALPGEPPPGLRAKIAAVAPPIVLLALLALGPGLAKALHDPFMVRVLIRIVIFAIVATALNLVLGFGGLVSLLQAGFFGVGGYAVAILAKHNFDSTLLFGLFPGTSDLLISAPLAIAVAALTATATGLVSLRTSGPYFIMITLAFNQMLFYFFVGLQAYGGDDGLQISSNLTVGSFDPTTPNVLFWICLATLGLALLFFSRLVDSRFGRVLRACEQNERRVAALGIAPLRYKLTAFVISGALTGFAGVLWAMSESFMSPSDMSWTRSGDFVVMAVLGGMRTVWGAAVGAAVYVLFEATFSSWTTYWHLPFGLLIILVATYFEGGLADLYRAMAGGHDHG